MSLTIRNVAREFTPAEAATITGVPVAQQRDWRRREIIPGKEGTGWTRFDVNDVIDLAVLRFFTRMGFAPSALSAIRHMAVLPTIAGIYENEDGYEFTGEEIDEALRQRVVGSSVGGVSSHILVITGDDMGNPSVVRVSNYNAVEEALARAASPNGVILDCFKLADHLIANAGGPLFRIEAEAE